MIVDLSHVSMATMRDAITVSEAPVIFSHSSAYELCNSSRNVQDSVLKSLVKNRGIIMLNFYSMFLSCGQNATIYHAVGRYKYGSNYSVSFVWKKNIRNSNCIQSKMLPYFSLLLLLLFFLSTVHCIAETINWVCVFCLFKMSFQFHLHVLCSSFESH